MATDFTQDNATLIGNFRLLQGRAHVARLLEIDVKTLNYLLYRNKTRNYRKFYIPKRDGTAREIIAPQGSLKILQQKLNHILSLIYKPAPSVYGFTRNRSAVQNAAAHLHNKLVFNIDLENFFPTIHLGRVRGMLMARPYKLPAEVATIIAQICCFEGRLPQGAPSSPVVSNMLCAKLDAQLIQLAKRCRCTYTRYADDITFSTSARSFPEDIVRVEAIQKDKFVMVGDFLNKVITENGFVVNQKKVRLQNRDERQVVTGVKVNVKLNVSRGYVHSLRGMLHAWKKYGYIAAAREYFSQHMKNDKQVLSFDNVVRGKLEYLKSVKTDSDYVWRGLANKYEKVRNQLSFDKYPLTEFDDRQEALWVIRCGIEQGSGFILKGIGLITCHHVIESGNPIHAFRGTDFVVPYNARVLKSDKDLDIAILEIITPGHANLPYFTKGNSDQIRPSSKITVCGFPQYQSGEKASIMTTEVVRFHVVSDIRRFIVSDILIGGYSGGPALNRREEVIGIVVTGIRNTSQIYQTALYGVIPINAIGSIL